MMLEKQGADPEDRDGYRVAGIFWLSSGCARVRRTGITLRIRQPCFGHLKPKVCKRPLGIARVPH